MPGASASNFGAGTDAAGFGFGFSASFAGRAAAAGAAATGAGFCSNFLPVPLSSPRPLVPLQLPEQRGLLIESGDGVFFWFRRSAAMSDANFENMGGFSDEMLPPSLKQKRFDDREIDKQLYPNQDVFINNNSSARGDRCDA